MMAAGAVLPPRILDDLDDVLGTALAENGIPGAIAGMWLGGQPVWLRARGVADVAGGRLMQTTDCVRIASITKSFVATLALQLVDDGLLSLDTSVAECCRDLPGAPAIELRQLLNNTSGLYDYVEDEEFQASLGLDPRRSRSPRELILTGVRHEPYFGPGEGYHYSNTNYILAGLMIEGAAGRPLAEVLRDKILRPLGLTHTELPGGFPAGDCIHGYMDDGAGVRDLALYHPSVIWAAGGMVSALEELSVWGSALGTGALLAPDTFEAQKAWVDVPGPATGLVRYGLGVAGVYDWIGHEGGFLGYNTAMYHHAERDATIVVLMNRSFQDRSVAGETFLRLGIAACPEICG
ncbi:MAG: serine hydrolase domain-containing protein [Candidatus Geothermincolia bacterium]